MTQQEKELTKIKVVGSRGSMANLGDKHNDECYTRESDILNELSHWGQLGKFQNKDIICPCDFDVLEDSDVTSITIRYTADEVEVTGNSVAKHEVITVFDLWDTSDQAAVKMNIAESDLLDYFKNKLTCNFIKVLIMHAREWGIRSITASGYNPVNNKGVKFQDVDYTQYNICITNPPFSLYSEFMEAILGKVDFIVLSPFMNRVTPSVGLPLMTKKAYFGFGANNNMGYTVMIFDNPTANDPTGTKRISCDWIVSYPDAQLEHDKLLVNNRSGIDYELYKEEYTVMQNMTMLDGSHPIRVPANGIPDNYSGWMFGSVNIIPKLNTEEFEWYGTNFMRYYNTTHPENNPFAHKTGNHMLKGPDGKQGFHGIVFRRKRSE